LTSKNTINVRFILRILLWRSSRLTVRASAAAKRAQRAKRSAESACWAAVSMLNWYAPACICNRRNARNCNYNLC
jgi:hypothetical protein